MKRRFLLPALVGIVLLLFVLVLSMPARLLPYFIDAQTLQISGVSGTLGSGTAARARLQLPDAYFHLGELTWKVAPLSLLRLMPRVQLRSVWGDQRGSVELRLKGDVVELRSVDMNVNAALVKQLLPVELQGRLGMLFDEITFSADSLLRADGRLVWQNAAWQSPGGRRALGSYVATFVNKADQIEANIVTLSGPVMVSGTVALSQRRYAVNLFIESGGGSASESAGETAGQEFHAELAQALSLIASPEENGYRLRLDGELKPN